MFQAAVGQEEAPSSLQGAMAKRLRHYSSGAYGASFFQDRRLRGHLGVRRGPDVRVPSPLGEALAIRPRSPTQWKNQPL